MDITKIKDGRVQEAQVRNTGDAGKAQGAGQAENASKTKKIGIGAATKTPHAAAKVEWSPEAEVAVEGLETAKATPDIRPDKVAALKAQIANGTYKMDPQKIADSMIQKSLEESVLARRGE